MPAILPLADAVAAISAKTPLGSVLRSKELAQLPVALWQRAQLSAGVTSARVLQTVQDRLAGAIAQQREQLANGKQATFDRNSFINSVREVAQNEGLSGDGSMTDITSVPRLGLIHDMQTAHAAGFARNKLDTSEGALLLYPAYRLGESTADDPRPLIFWERRWFEAGTSTGWQGALPGQFVALKTSPIWAALSTFGTPWAPFDWGSTRQLEEVDRTEAIALGLIQPQDRPPVGAAGGEDFNAGLEASARNLSPQMMMQLRTWFGNAVNVVGDAIQWATG